MPKLNKDYPCRKEFRLSREMEKDIAKACNHDVSESEWIREAIGFRLDRCGIHAPIESTQVIFDDGVVSHTKSDRDAIWKRYSPR